MLLTLLARLVAGRVVRAELRLARLTRARLRVTPLTRAQLRLVRGVLARMQFEGRPVGRMEEVMQGEAVRIDVTFSDAAGAPVAVGGATLRAQPPQGAARSYPLAAGAAAGEFSATVLFDVAGRWWLEGDCATPTPAVTPSLMVTVRPRAAPPP